MTDELPEIRKGHPYVMYEMLRSTGKGIDSTQDKMDKFDYSLIKGPLTFTGNGTAYHSGIIGAQILSGSSADWRVIQAYELEKFSHASGTVAAISHTGKTKSTVDAIRKVSGNCRTVAITHYENSPLVEECDNSIVIGDFPDRSLCNTKAFFDNVFAVMSIASRYGGVETDIAGLAAKVKASVDSLDSVVKDIASDLGGIESIFVLGAGPDYAVAREAAQKLKEATHLHAEGIELEEFNHGCTSVIDDRTLVVIIESEIVSERSQDIVRACREVGTKTLVLNGNGDYTISTAATGNVLLDPVIHVVPLYYLAYHLALVKGINPDYLRFEDERYLRYDKVVFPPGAH